MAARPPRLYFSFRSPYSWMAIEQLRREVPALFQRFDLVPYWDPDPELTSELKAQGAELPYAQMSKPKHLYVLMDTKRLAAKFGLQMAWPVDIDCWWEMPHLAWLCARQAGAAESCYDALIRARWTRGDDICQADVLHAIAAEIGLDPGLMTGAARNPRFRAEGLRCLVQAYEDDIFGVPYLLAGRHRFWGLDRVELALEQLARDSTGAPIEPPPPELLEPARRYDADTAGGCG